jgi:hypothetical protein
MFITLAWRGQRWRSSRHTRVASRLLSKCLCRLRSVDHLPLLPSYQPVILPSVLDRSVMRPSMLDDLREQISAWLSEGLACRRSRSWSASRRCIPTASLTSTRGRFSGRSSDGARNKHTGSSPKPPSRSAVWRFGRQLEATAARPRGSTGTPRAALRQTHGLAPLRAGPPYGLRGQPTPPATRQSSVTSADEAIGGSGSGRRLTRGDNGAPEQLAKKFAHLEFGGECPSACAAVAR